MWQWHSRRSWAIGGADSVVQTDSDRCNVIVKHRQAIPLEGIPPMD